MVNQPVKWELPLHPERSEAHALLDRMKDGQLDQTLDEINSALRETGDVPEATA